MKRKLGIILRGAAVEGRATVTKKFRKRFLLNIFCCISDIALEKTYVCCSYQEEASDWFWGHVDGFLVNKFIFILGNGFIFSCTLHV